MITSERTALSVAKGAFDVPAHGRTHRLTFQCLDNQGSRSGSVLCGKGGQEAFDGPLSRINTVEDFGSFKVKVHCINVFYQIQWASASGGDVMARKEDL